MSMRHGGDGESDTVLRIEFSCGGGQNKENKIKISTTMYTNNYKFNFASIMR
jgi:hypothetical protein